MGLTAAQFTCDADGALIPTGDPVYRVQTTVEQVVLQEGVLVATNGNGSIQVLCKDHVAAAAPLAAPATVDSTPQPKT